MNINNVYNIKFNKRHQNKQKEQIYLNKTLKKHIHFDIIEYVYGGEYEVLK